MIINYKLQIINYKFKHGFTLIELILYISMVSLMLTALIPFAWNVIEGAEKISVEQEINTQARYFSERIKKEIKSASSVTTCNSTTLSLVNPTASLNPTTFTYASNEVKITQGSQIPSPGIRIHSNDSLITAFNCTNFSGTNTDNVQVTFTIANNYTSSRQEYTETLNIELAAETRN